MRCATYCVLRNSSCVFKSSSRKFRGLSRFVGNVGKLMADRATGSKDDERQGGRREVALDGSLVYIPTSPRGEAEENRNSPRVRETSVHVVAHVHAGSFYLAKLSQLVLCACQFVKAGFSRSYGNGDPSFEPFSKYSPSSPFTTTNPIRAVIRADTAMTKKRKFEPLEFGIQTFK